MTFLLRIASAIVPASVTADNVDRRSRQRRRRLCPRSPRRRQCA